MRIISFLLLTGTLAAPVSWAAESAETNAGKTATDGAAEFRVPKVTWRMRNLVGSDRLIKWHVGIAGTAFPGNSVVQAAARAEALSLNFIEASSSMKAGPDIEKNFDYRLNTEERNAVKSALKNIKLLTYSTGPIPKDWNTRRQIFEFAKGMGVETLVIPADPSAGVDLDSLANQFGMNISFVGPLLDVMKTITGRGKRLGAAADTGLWLEQGNKPLDAFAVVKGRVNYLRLRDRSATGVTGHDVILGQGVGNLPDFLKELDRLNMRPLIIVIDATTAAKTPAEVEKNVEGFETVVLPTLGEFVTEASHGFPIRGLQNMLPEQRRQIEESGKEYIVNHWMMAPIDVNLPPAVRSNIMAALPKTAMVKPRKPRKLLIIDACVANMSHNVIPHANLALELMGKNTGAYEPIFSNDFNNLKYPKIKEYDAIFLNSTVGELFPDPEVRAGLLRFVREGGGLGLLHGASYASRNWPEFSEMVGAADGPHHVQMATLKVEHPQSPITRSIGPDFRYSDEYYRFYDTGPTAVLSREKVHVLLSIDMEKTPDFNQNNPPYIRKDNDYPIAWIKSYGKGRVFNNAMGHTPELFQNPKLAEHFLAAIQFILGDLDDDTTPSIKPAKKRRD